MSSKTAQQTKLDLELVPKEKRLKIRKCNGRLNSRKIQREPTFQVILDDLALTPYYSAFLSLQMFQKYFDALPTQEEIASFLRELGHYEEIISLNDVIVVQMHQPSSTFVALINRSLSGKTTGLDKLRLSRAQILCGATPPKIARKFKKASPSKKDLYLNLVLVDEEPKYTKKKVDVGKGKGIKLLSEVSLTKDAQYKEVRKKSLRDFHKTHPSDDNNNGNNSESDNSDEENDSDDDNTQSDNEKWSNSRQETDENESGSESDHQKNEKEVEDDEV
nr:hypothetical protein [Tanacetum cinerariifolium]